MEDSVSVCLEHLRVRVEARVAELGNLLGQQLHSVRRVAKDDRLVDLELRREQNERDAEVSTEMGRVVEDGWRTFEKRVFRQWTFCRSSTNA